MVEPERLSGIDRRHFDRALDRHTSRVEVANVLHEHARLDLLDHIDAVIDHWAIGSEGNIDACAPRVGEGTDTAAADGFAGGGIDKAAAGMRHVLDIEFGHVDAVDEDPMRVQETELHQVANVRAAGFAKVTKKALFD